jgi:ABC-2 type transport system ATP-binding protein
MLIATDLSKTYGARAVLSGVSFQLDDGDLVALVGPNGAGKSSLLHIIVGLIAPSTGDVYASDGDHLVAAARGRIGFCPDDLPQAELLTGSEYLDMVAGIRGLRRVPEAERALVDGMRLTDSLDRLIATYSHGMRRKLQVVAALLHEPELLVLDEPFRGLDPESAAIVKTLLRVCTDRGSTVLVSTHDLLVAQELCDRVLVLREGTLVADASMREFETGSGAETLERSFERMTGIDVTAQQSSARFFEGLDLLASRA